LFENIKNSLDKVLLIKYSLISFLSFLPIFERKHLVAFLLISLIFTFLKWYEKNQNATLYDSNQFATGNTDGPTG